MMRIPTSALLLGLAGLIPFLWGGATAFMPYLEALSLERLGPRFTGQVLLQSYGVVILAFMSGVIWGFAARSEGRIARLGYGWSVVPALWAFFFGTIALPGALWALLFGFVGLLFLDWTFAKHGAAPEWWITLRLILTSVVVLCLAVGGVS